MDRAIGPASNILTGIALLVVLLGGGGAITAAFVFAQRSQWSTDIGQPVAQPVPFSHAHHVAGLGLDCVYCHSSFERSAFAGMPTSETCMNCHAQLYTNAEMLAPIRQSWETGRPVQWQRVHDLPDFVFFNHSTHVHAGVSCVTCHGDVGQMPMTWKSEPLSMTWCLDCHRHPAIKELGAPRGAIEDGPPVGASLAARPVLANCTACHR